MTLVPGMVVEVTGISKKSFWIFRAVESKGMKVTCFCRWKRGTLGVIDSVYEDGTTIITMKSCPEVIGVGYSGDLTPYYEAER